MLYYSKKLLVNGEECIFRSPVGIQDARFLLMLSSRLLCETGYLQPLQEKDPCAETEAAFLELAAESSDLLVLAAEKDGRFVGSACLMNSGKPTGSGEIGVAVLKKEWGLGIGSHLLRILIKKAKSAGYPRLYLTVKPDNTRARRMYQSFGFTVLNDTSQPLEMILDL